MPNTLASPFYRYDFHQQTIGPSPCDVCSAPLRESEIDRHMNTMHPEPILHLTDYGQPMCAVEKGKGSFMDKRDFAVSSSQVRKMHKVCQDCDNALWRQR